MPRVPIKRVLWVISGILVLALAWFFSKSNGLSLVNLAIPAGAWLVMRGLT